MRRLRRRGVKAPADWKKKVDAAFADAAAFWKAAKEFERLVEQGKKRKKGFSAYAPHVLRVDYKGDLEFPDVWGDERVKQAIAGMSDGFCAYCQSPVSSNHAGKGGEEKPPGQVDHFRPKSRFPAQAYDWNNYFLGCVGCNGAKHDKWPSGGYVRPDQGKPGRRFKFNEDGEITARKDGDEQAENTVEDFGLTRHWLTVHRGSAIKSHLSFVSKFMGRSGIELKDLLITAPIAFSEAINQNVRRVWAKGRRRSRI